MNTDELAALHARCFTTPRPWSADEFTALLASNGVFLHATKTGFALGREIVGEVELLTFAIDPTHQKQGHGRALLATFENDAIARGATEVFLEVACNNIAACTLYQSAGYTESGRRRGYYSPPSGVKIDAIVMRKSLI